MVRDSGEKVGIIYDDGEKRVSGAPATEMPGSGISNRSKRARLLDKRRACVCDLTRCLLSCKKPAAKLVEMGGGVWIQSAQYKKQLMTCFKQIWLVIRSEVVPLLDPAVIADDFLKALCSLPLAKIKLDMDIGDLTTAADASEAGSERTPRRN